jgi:hypothetical protein
MLPQVFKFIFEIQRKMSNEEITRRKISFPTYKTFFFSLFPFAPLLLLNLIILFYFIHFKQFKVL